MESGSRTQLRLLSSLKDLKLQSKSQIVINEEGKRKQKKFLALKIEADDEGEIYENFTLIPKSKNTLDKNLISKSLATHFAFSALVEDKQLKDLLIDQFKLCRVQEGDYLLKQNDKASSFFILHDGKLSVQVNGSFNKKISPGQGFGQLALLYSAPRFASIKADKVSYLWYLDRCTFRKAISSNIKRNFNENRQFIQNNPFFEYLSNHEKDMIASISMSQKFEKNTKLFKQGQVASSMYILKSGKLKRQCNNIFVGFIEKNQSLDEYATLQKGCHRKETVSAVEDSQVICLGVQDIQNVLGRSLPIIILRNQIKRELKKIKKLSQLSKEYLQKIIDSFQIRNVLQNQIIIHQSLKCKDLIVLAIQGAYDVKNQKKKDFYGGECFENQTKQNRYEFQLKFSEQGKIAWTSIYQIQKSFGSTLQNALTRNQQQINSNVQRRSRLSLLQSCAQKYQLNKLEALKKLGQGQFGTVLLVRNKENGNRYALKCISKQETIKYRLQKHLRAQKNVLESIQSPFIVDYMRSFKDQYYVYFMTQFINGLQLFDTIRIIGLLNMDQSRFYIATMLHVLQTLHSHFIVYRDLKPQNIIVCEDGYLKVVDMGTCKRFEPKTIHRTFTIIGTPNYMAPQILSGKGYTYNVDLWSLGIILFEFLAGYVPYGEDADDPYEIYQQILTSSLNFPKHMNNSQANLLISQLLSKNPGLRLGGSYNNLKNHIFFNNFAWHDLTDKKIKAPYKLPKQRLMDEERIKKLPVRPISTFLKNYGKPIVPRKSLEQKWDQQY